MEIKDRKFWYRKKSNLNTETAERENQLLIVAFFIFLVFLSFLA